METLISSLLRPYRFTYSINDLGNKHHPQYTRKDHYLLNQRDLKLQYSYYQNRNESNICAVYCHCNSGSRVEGIPYIEQFIAKGWNVCLFDFSGSGNSEGEFISLGYHESRDLECILKELRNLNNHRFVLWGRSMGASTIITFLSQTKRREDIIGCVLDSPYASLCSLIKQIGIQKSGLPGFIMEKIIDYACSKIKQTHLFDIKTLEPIKFVSQLELPLMFITSPLDQCVKSDDIVEMYRFSGSKNKRLQYIEKHHNSHRGEQIINIGSNFLSRCLEERNKKKKQIRVVFNRLHKDITGNNMADLIIQAEKQRTQLRKMKSHSLLKDHSSKQNRSNNLKTQFTSVIDEYQTQYPPKKMRLKNFKTEASRKLELRTIKIHAIKQ